MTYRELWLALAPLYGEREAHAVADYVLGEAFGLGKADIICGAVEQMSSDDAATLELMLGRLVKGEPVQYVVGRAMFCGRWFKVCPGVLIPRPETEELCTLIAAGNRGRTGLKMVDIGTGSGCIAVTMALDMPGNEVTAWDIAPEALATAEENARLLGADVRVERHDILAETSSGVEWDIIVSNPPYICESERKDMHRNVTEHEPALALFVPDGSPLLFYRAIARYAARNLRSGGSLYFELNPLHADETADMMRREGFRNIMIKNDEYGKQRMLRADI